MCNEYSQKTSLDELLREFAQVDLPLGWDGGAPNLEPRPAVRPTDPSYIITGQAGGAHLSQLRWGFPGPRGPVINFRSEGRAFGRGRCPAPARGFFACPGAPAPN